MLANARIAAARGTSNSALAAGFEAVIIATDQPAAFEPLPAHVPVDADARGAEFGFDRRPGGVARRPGRRPSGWGRTTRGGAQAAPR